MKKLNAIDLFSGAGGLSEGFLETDKFKFLAHVEWEKPMVDTLRNNLMKNWNYSENEAHSPQHNVEFNTTVKKVIFYIFKEIFVVSIA